MNQLFPSLRVIRVVCRRHAGALPEAVLAAAELAAETNDDRPLFQASERHLRATLYSRGEISVLEPAVLLAGALDTRLGDSIVAQTFQALLRCLLLGGTLQDLFGAMSARNAECIVSAVLQEQFLDIEERPHVVPVLTALQRADGRSAAIRAGRAAHVLAREPDEPVNNTLDCAMHVLLLAAVARRFAQALN